jgi:ribosomal protein L22
MSAEEEKTTPAPEEPAEKAPAAKVRRRKKAKAEPSAETAAAAETPAPSAETAAPAGEKAADGPAPAETKADAGKGGKAEKAEKATADEPPAAPRAKAAASPKEGTARRSVVRARARYVRTSARKARIVCVHIRGKSVEEARAILAFTPREVARDWSKLLESAVANAESNHELLQDDLIVREAYADEGPTIKRFRPRAMGRATPIRKRTSHLTITLTPGAPVKTNRKKS